MTTHYDIESIDTEKFQITPGSFGGRPAVLINPHRGVGVKYEQDEMNFRSLVLDSTTGEVLSAGFPKFRNFGEDKGETRRTKRLFASGAPAYVTEKYDGSLLIRAVVDGKVHWRTRGAFGYESMPCAADIKATLDAFPALANPDYMSGCSMLYEFCAPTNRIVLPYSKICLYPIGYVRHSDMSLHRKSFDVVPNDKPLSQLVQEQHLREEAEGAVLWIQKPDGSYRLTKLKSGWYMARHGLATSFTPARCAKHLAAARVTSFDAADKYLADRLPDWETIQSAMGAVNDYLARVDALLKMVEDHTQDLDGKDNGLRARAIKARLAKSGITDKAAFAVCFAKFIRPQEALDVICGNAAGLSAKRLRNFRVKYNIKLQEETP